MNSSTYPPVTRIHLWPVTKPPVNGAKECARRVRQSNARCAKWGRKAEQLRQVMSTWNPNRHLLAGKTVHSAMYEMGYWVQLLRFEDLIQRDTCHSTAHELTLRQQEMRHGHA